MNQWAPEPYIRQRAYLLWKALVLGLALKLGGLSKLVFSQNLITIFLINQSLIWKLPDGRYGLCYYVLKWKYPNNSISQNRPFLDAAADWIFGAAAGTSPEGRCFWLTLRIIWTVSFEHMIAETMVPIWEQIKDWLISKIVIKFFSSKKLKVHQT